MRARGWFRPPPGSGAPGATGPAAAIALDPAAALPGRPLAGRAASAGGMLLRLRTALLALCLVSGSVIAVDAFLVEPDWIEVTRHVEQVAAWPSSGPDLTLVHLSDLHIERLGARERRAIDLINGARPDLVLITGDLVRTGRHPAALAAFLGALRARRGTYVVWGNHDDAYGFAGATGRAVVEGAGAVLLRNEHRRLRTRAGRIVIAGLDDPVTGRDNLRRAMRGVRRNEVALVLAHSPEIARDLGAWDIDLLLAGHTHGGQVRLPLLGPPYLPAGTRPYAEGWFDVGGGARMHVSRGLGWCILPMRFLCRPRIDVITLRGGSGESARTHRESSHA